MKIGHFHTGSALFGFHGGLQVTERLENSMRKKNYIFTNKKHSNRAIMSTILGGISLVSLGIVTYLSYSQGGVMHGGYGVTGVGHHLFPDRTDPGNTDPSGKRYLSYLSRAGNNIKCCCPWRCQLFAVSGKPSVTDILEQKHWITQQLFR